MSDLSHELVCVVGPTASGKTKLAQALAIALDGEVVSADSMQVYRGMDVGTAKLPPSQRRVAHWGLDLIDPGQSFSAACFQDYARARIREIDAREKRCILAGGSGFYVRAVVDDYDFPPGGQEDNPVRERFGRIARQRGADALWELLNERDPQSAALIAPTDVKRVVRAFELLEAGESYARQRARLAQLPQFFPAVFIGLFVERARLYARIDARVDRMVEAGLVEEVEGLLNAGFREGLTAPQAIGYKEVLAALEGEITLDAAVEQIKRATRRYAKRQGTWFRKDLRIQWIDVTERSADEVAAEALALVERRGSSSRAGTATCSCI